MVLGSEDGSLKNMPEGGAEVFFWLSEHIWPAASISGAPWTYAYSELRVAGAKSSLFL